jgi:CIC family chloride channel protein
MNEDLPIAPSLDLTSQAAGVPPRNSAIDTRVLGITAAAMLIAVAAGFVAQGMISLIGLITNIAFYGRFSTAFVSPAGNHLGVLVIGVPVIGGALVGLMARYGSTGIRGHGIPEAMEQILTNQSRIPPRLIFLKPISAAIAIGTGGPFGAEGPIIATGGALGSLVGQVMKITADERKTLLAAGAAAGMAATFGSPVSAVLLAIELLLFEYRARSFIPVALASTVATATHMAFFGSAPIFSMAALTPPGGVALSSYVLVGALAGIAAVGVTRTVYFVEDLFEKLPIHWMWWPVFGAIAVGVIGYFQPRTLGVGYDNIDAVLGSSLAGRAILTLCVFKFLSWAISLGSGTSGGTLAPLFTIGGGLGAVLGRGLIRIAPGAGIDPRVAALVGMSAMFAGASRALLASVVFAFETTMQPLGLLPLLGGCSAAYLISSLFMRHTIMTEKIARRGIPVPEEYHADYLSQTRVADLYTKDCVTLRGDDRLQATRDWIASRAPGSAHQGFPVLDKDGALLGVITHRDIMDLTAPAEQTLRELIKRPVVVIFTDQTLRQVADLMVLEDIGRLPVVRRDAPRKLIGILSRSDVLAAHRRRLDESHQPRQTLRLWGRGRM